MPPLLLDDTHELASDGRTVWLNCCKTQTCVARYSSRLLEVMPPGKPPGCGYIIEEAKPTGAWARFVEMVHEHLAVKLPAEIPA
jgi:hypothetical protein